MKRVVTAFLFLFLSIGIIQNSIAQVTVQRHAPISVASSAAGHSAMGATVAPALAPISESSPLATIQTDAISYFQDTTGGNWWLYAPIFSAGPDSLNFFSYGSILYTVIQDSIGPLQINLGGGQTVTDFDTMYTRVMGLRVSVPTDIKTPRLDSASITLDPIAINPRDSIEFWVVPMEDVQFQDQNGNVTGVYPIPDLFASTANGTYIAKGSIPASELTPNAINTVTVNFGHKALGTRKHFGICVFVDGPDFINDTIAYQLDANLQAPPAVFQIDTDGSIGTYQGVDSAIAMRTYTGNLDGGNLVLNGQKSIVGGMKGFFIGFSQFDPTTGQPTGEVFAGNLVMTTYMSGTALGVDDQPVNGYSLSACFPNPVNTSAEISYTLGKSGPVVLKVYNTLGEEVANISNGLQSAGPHSMTFDANNLPNGMYYYTLQSGDYAATQSMVVNK